MSTAQSGSPMPAATAAATNSHWATHGPVLTACLISINLFMILLIFFYFWRYFSGKRGPGAADEEASSSSNTSPATSPRASRRMRDPEQPDIAASLPVSVFDSSADGAAGKAADCAVCIVEFRDGDLARLLPRCGHRFHAACVDAWLQLHDTCPLCRASVVAPAAEPKNDPKDEGDGLESPV